MTNCKLDDAKIERPNARLAAVAAVNIVKQILDDAYLFANAVRDSGLTDSWRYLPLCEVVNKGALLVKNDNDSHDVHDSINNESNIKIIATSTPQKCSENKRYLDNNEDEYVNGQGDANNVVTQSYLEDSKSPSMLINNLFDMSEVEREFEATTAMNEVADNSDITKIIESYVNDALNMAFDEDIRKEYSVKKNSAVVNDFEKAMLCANVSLPNLQMEQEEADLMRLIPHTYLTLNREDEQESDKTDIYINNIEESKTPFQEIKLLSSHCSQDTLSTKIKDNKISATGSRRSILARSCRTHGARLFTCLRKWWTRSIPKRRRECNVKKDSCSLSASFEYHSTKVD